jgi:hypothetical protein
VLFEFRRNPMTPLSALSRRTLVAAAALGALAPTAEARKRKRKPKPPPPPLAFAAATVGGISIGPNDNQFSYRIDAPWFHPASGEFGTITNGTLILAAVTAPDQVRALIVARVRSLVAEALGNRGEAVPEARVQVTVV